MANMWSAAARIIAARVVRAGAYSGITPGALTNHEDPHHRDGAPQNQGGTHKDQKSYPRRPFVVAVPASGDYMYRVERRLLPSSRRITHRAHSFLFV